MGCHVSASLYREKTESGTGEGPTWGIQTFPGWRRASSGFQLRCPVSVFPSRYLLRFLSKPFLACSSFPLILELPCHSVAMVAEPFDLLNHRPVDLLSFIHQTALSCHLFSVTPSSVRHSVMTEQHAQGMRSPKFSPWDCFF